MNRKTFFCIASSLIAFAGCDNAESQRRSAPEVSTAPALNEPKSAASAESGKSSGAGPRQYTGIKFDIPADWREVPNQTMVDSKYIVPSAKGDMELTLTSMGGGIPANIERWAGQIRRPKGEEVKRDQLDINGLPTTLIDVRGTYTSNTAMGNSDSKDDWRLVGLGIPVPQRDFFVRLVGPREAVSDFYEELMKIVNAAELQK